ncbi:collagen alpha-1(I) chain-like isoform X2 [Mercenaria mercenaria]|uniref:collagen alpha-1(I) chain-like isoform X2 n=1 Tax=Mercenaria mercenaria TaxID=6596 RepID=UPI00234F37FD|nr:collagen alpha-1(I) chain-like isoform X2 [Mercenaria mercenaria]
MDSQKHLICIYSLILFIFPNILDTQRITCPNPCDIGYTCAMVRHGGQPSRPGCINMQEAIMLHQALNGGPSGPGTGVNSQAGTGVPQPNVGLGFPQSPRRGDPIPHIPQSPSPGNSIPGMNFLGGTGSRQQGFEQRFEQGISRQPQNFINSPSLLGRQGNFGMSGIVGPINGQFGNPQRPTGMAGPSFLDPTTGQLGPRAGQFGPSAGQFGPPAGQFGPVGAGSPPIGFSPQVDGGHSHTSSASGNRDNTNIDPHDSSHGGGNLPRNNGFPACLHRNAWCPFGYVCQRHPTGDSGQSEDRCVLRDQVHQRRRLFRPSSRFPGSQPVTSGRNSPRSRSPTLKSGSPSLNRESPGTQVSPDSSPWIRGPHLIGTDSIQNMARVEQAIADADGPIEQSQVARDSIMPDLLKKGGVQRQSLSGNRSFSRMNAPGNKHQILVSPASSPFRAQNSSSTFSDAGRVQNNTQTCTPCKDHKDCNDIFTYCINKIPCVGKVCYRVT